MNGLRLFIDIAYLVSALVFVAGLKGLGKLRSAKRGSTLLVVAMLLAFVATLAEIGDGNFSLVLGALAVGSLGGAVLGFAVKGKGLGGVALATASGGASSSLFALSAAFAASTAQTQPASLARVLGSGTPHGYVAAPALVIALLAGAAAVGAGIVSFTKSSGSQNGFDVPARSGLWPLLGLAAATLVLATAFLVEAPDTRNLLAVLSVALGFVGGVLLALPAGSRDVPAIVVLSNGAAGLAAAALGFLVMNNGLIIVGGIAFAASVTFASALAEGMNRTFSGLFTGAKGQAAVDSAGADYKNVRSCGVQEAAMVLEDAQSVVIVPGYGYAVAQAQQATRELAQLLEKRGAKVRYAVHPMAGRMPGHMNALLAEADVPYAQLFELEQINDDFKATDVVIALGGNDIINPDGERRDSAVYGLPVLRVSEARTVFVIKRSLRAGHSGAKNPLFEAENTMLLFGDAKKMLQSIATELKGSSGLGHAA